MTVTQRNDVLSVDSRRKLHGMTLAERVRLEEERVANRYRTQLSIYHSLLRDRYLWSLLCAFPLVAFLLAGTVSVLAHGSWSAGSELAAIHSLSATLALGALLVGVRSSDPVRNMAIALIGARKEITRGYLYALLLVIGAISAATIIVVVLVLVAPPINSSSVLHAVQMYASFAGIAGVYSLTGLCFGTLFRATLMRLSAASMVWLLSVIGLLLYPMLAEKHWLLSNMAILAVPGVLSGQMAVGGEGIAMWVVQLAMLVALVPVVFYVVEKIVLKSLEA